jgi:hypothetical protein
MICFGGTSLVIASAAKQSRGRRSLYVPWIASSRRSSQ